VTYDEVPEWRVIESKLGDSATIPLSQHLGGVVAAPHADTLRQDLFQLRSGTACDEGPDQRQSVVVEIRLHITPTNTT